MGFFDYLDGLAKSVTDTVEVLEKAKDQLKENEKFPSIYMLPLETVPAERADSLRDAKVGLFGGKDKKKFIESIEKGRTKYAEVLLLAREERVTERSENSENITRKYYYKIADLDGKVLREDVPAIDDEYAVALPYNEGRSASETGCADLVDPQNYPHMILLIYYLDDSDYCVLLTKEQFDDLTMMPKYAGSLYHRALGGLGYTW